MNRRGFFQAAAAAGMLAVRQSNCAMAAARSAGSSNQSKRLLDALRDEVHHWSEALWDERAGGFRQNAEVGANLLSTADVAWLRCATNDPDLTAGHRNRWVRYHRQQDCRRALERLAGALPDFFADNRRRYEDNPHSMLAVVHTFGLLQESFPERFPSCQGR